ncbi:MAG: 50S ribosomal protein L11 methyltransferase [Actinobacteria bacterium]|nr:50S ribosomal protein L11 methyltransferase [Actinomycetota bacterium]
MSDSRTRVDEALRRLAVLGERLPSAARPSLARDSLDLVHALLDEIQRATASVPVEQAVQALYRRLVPRWHFPMLNDDERNGGYEAALAEHVRPHHTVLDIGAGSGVLAVIAARAGARRVMTCEMSATIADVAREVVAADPHGEVIEVIAKRSDELTPDDMGGRADVIVSETFDCALLGESLLAIMRDARERLLAPGGTLIPSAARITAMLIESDAVFRLNRVDTTRGIDVSAFNRFSTASYFPVRLFRHPYEVLSERADVVDLDFAHDDLLPAVTHHELIVTKPGVCHGVAFWFDVTLSSTAHLENSPENPTSNWHQAVQLFDKPLPVETGDRVAIAVAYDDTSISFSRSGPRISHVRARSADQNGEAGG